MRDERSRDRPPRLAAVTALALTGLAAACAVWLVVPAPNRLAWVGGWAARELSPLVIAVALVGLAAAVLAWRAGARQRAAAAAALAAATLALVSVAIIEAAEDARRLGVTLAPGGHLSSASALLARPEATTKVYARPDGQPLRVDVALPDDVAEPVPAVVLVHGGAWQWGRRGMTPWWNAWLVEQGYAVFDIDYRLEPAPTWRTAPGDVACAVGWVRSNADRMGVDPDRLALMGSSAGGHLALLAAYTADDDALPATCAVERTDVQAVVAWYPPADLVHSYALAERVTPLDGQAVLERFTGGTPATVPGVYRVASPLTHAGAGAPPTLLLQGARDQMQSPADTVALARRLADAGVDMRLLWLDHAGHGFHPNWGGWANQITRPHVAVFLDRHLDRAAPRRRVRRVHTHPQRAKGHDDPDHRHRPVRVPARRHVQLHPPGSRPRALRRGLAAAHPRLRR